MKNLYKINDILNENFIQLPLAIIANQKYRVLSSDAKILYALLCNRLRLSQLNKWVNEDNEVYLIYTREQASEVLGISYKTVIKTFRELLQSGLLYEKRRGKNLANHLFLSKLDGCDERGANEFNKEFDTEPVPEKAPPQPENGICKNYISEKSGTGSETGSAENGESKSTELSFLQSLMCKKDRSVPVNFTEQDVKKIQPSKKEIKNKEKRYIKKSQSANPIHALECEAIQKCAALKPVINDSELEAILENCELSVFEKQAGLIYQSAIERLYYSEHFTIGNAKLPKERIRSYLWRLNADMLFNVHQALLKNKTKLKNPIGYVMSMIINAVCENNIELYAYAADLPCGKEIDKDVPD